jgi:hypothetical protein
MMEPLMIRGYCPVSESGEISMLGRILAATLVVGGAMTTSGAALAQQDPVAGAVAGAIVGAAIATGAIVPYEHREPLREYVVRENRRPINMRMKSWSAANCGPDPTNPIRCPSATACPNTITQSSTTAS